MSDDLKWCRKCGTWQPAYSFSSYKDLAHRAAGLYRRCAECNRQEQKAGRLADDPVIAGDFTPKCRPHGLRVVA